MAAEHTEIHGLLSPQQKEDLILAWAIGSTSNSNTITLVKDGRLIGNGAGQQDRIGAAQLALARTSIEVPEFSRLGNDLIVSYDRSKTDGAVAYSDSFFPFADGPMLLANAGVKAILTSSGSRADTEVFKALNDAGVTVVAVLDKIARGFAKH